MTTVKTSKKSATDDVSLDMEAPNRAPQFAKSEFMAQLGELATGESIARAKRFPVGNDFFDSGEIVAWKKTQDASFRTRLGRLSERKEHAKKLFTVETVQALNNDGSAIVATVVLTRTK